PANRSSARNTCITAAPFAPRSLRPTIPAGALTGAGPEPTPASRHHCGLEPSTPYCLPLAFDSTSQKPAAVSQAPPFRSQACPSDSPAAAALALDSYSQTLTSLTHQPWFLMHSWRVLSTAGSLACARSVPA